MDANSEPSVLPRLPDASSQEASVCIIGVTCHDLSFTRYGRHTYAVCVCAPIDLFKSKFSEGRLFVYTIALFARQVSFSVFVKYARVSRYTQLKYASGYAKGGLF